MQQKRTSIQNIQYFFVCLFFASLNFEVYSPIVANLSIAKMAAFLYMSVSLFTPIGRLFNTKNIRAGVLASFLMFFVMVFSSLIHSNAVVFNTTIFLNIIMFWLLLNHARRDERVFKEGLLCFAISSGVVGILFLMGIGVDTDMGGRVTIFGDNSNETGVKMAVSILFLLNYCLNNTQNQKIKSPWLLALVYPMLMLMFGGASRTALILLVLGLFVFIILYPAKWKISKVLWLLIGIRLVAAGWGYLQQQELLMARMQTTIDEGNMSGRDYIWQVYLQLIAEHPVLGLGFSGWNTYALQVFGLIRSPHNVIIEVLLYSGVIGLFFFVILLVSVYKNAYVMLKHKGNIGPLLLSIAALALILSGQALGVKLFWTICAYCVSYKVCPDNDINDNFAK